jgi:hypothetical protein
MIGFIFFLLVCFAITWVVPESIKAYTFLILLLSPIWGIVGYFLCLYIIGGH